MIGNTKEKQSHQTSHLGPRNPKPEARIPVMESFHSLQGEGFHTGKSAFFIRLGGCDVGCHWCDVKDSWDVSSHPLVAISDLVHRGAAHNPALVVVTGGEPLMHDLTGLTAKIKAQGLKTHLETSGAHQMSGDWDWICFSPKKFKQPLRDIYQQAHELKIVVYNASDFQWAETHARQVNNECNLFLQPEWSKADQMMPLIVDYVKNNPQWRISIQTHKYLHLP